MKKLTMTMVLFLALASSNLFSKTEFGVMTGQFIVPNMANDKIDQDHYQEIGLAGEQLFLKESRTLSPDINALVRVAIGEGTVKMSTIEVGLEIVHKLGNKENGQGIGLEVTAGAHHLCVDLPESYYFDGTGAVCSASIFIEAPLFSTNNLKIYLGTSALPQGSVGRFRPGSKPGLAVDAGGKLTASELFKLGASIVF